MNCDLIDPDVDIHGSHMCSNSQQTVPVIKADFHLSYLVLFMTIKEGSFGWNGLLVKSVN